MPDSLLFLAFWGHMLATVFWLGSFGAFSFFLSPQIKATLSNGDYSKWLLRNGARMNSIAWISIGLLTISGLFQMTENPNYEGLMQIGNLWSQAIFSKHMIFIAMVLMASLMGLKWLPALKSAQLRKALGENHDEEFLIGRIEKAVRVNVWLGTLTLALTALARIS